MEILTLTPLKILAAAAILLALYGGYRYFPNRKIFFLFCLLLLGSGSVVFLAHKPAPPAPAAVTQEQKAALQQQQQVFHDWYADYNKNIDSMNHQWQQYHRIMEAFKNDEISIQTVYIRLTQLQQDSAALKDTLDKFEPPAALNDTNYALTAQIIKKTRDHLAKENEVITKTKEAADPAKLKTDKQPEQVRQLHRVMILLSPVSLNISEEISQLKASLTMSDDD